eukprot:scaffold116145_cov93-Cyclotella_meneghiniana.AAC.1
MTPQSEHAPSRVDEVCSPSGRAVFQAAERVIFFGMVWVDEGTVGGRSRGVHPPATLKEQHFAVI